MIAQGLYYVVEFPPIGYLSPSWPYLAIDVM